MNSNVKIYTAFSKSLKFSITTDNLIDMSYRSECHWSNASVFGNQLYETSASDEMSRNYVSALKVTQNLKENKVCIYCCI